MKKIWQVVKSKRFRLLTSILTVLAIVVFLSVHPETNGLVLVVCILGLATATAVALYTTWNILKNVGDGMPDLDHL